MSTFGEELKRERELRQVSLREIAEATKISLRHLEALERNDFSDLPGGVFNRGFVRAYAQYIGVDAESMVTSYLLEEQTREGERAPRYGSEPVLRSHRANLGRSVGAGNGWLSPVQLRVLLLVVAVLAAIAATFLVRAWLARPEPPPVVTPAQAAPGAVPQEVGADIMIKESPARPEDDDAGDATPGPVAAPPGPTEEIPGTNAAATDAAPAPDGMRTRIRIVRGTTGRINCDNTRIEVLDGMKAGTTLELLCRRELVIDAEDGGAVLLAFGDAAPSPVGRDGQRISNQRIDIAALRGSAARP